MDFKVSIIIPVYNVEDFLIECLESIISQTLKDIEIICVNDGSTDKSADILNDYRLRYDNIKVISIKNQGVANARNLGITQAHGQMCCFLDPDDKYPSNDVLEYLYEVMVKQKVKICGGNALLLRNGEILETPIGDYQKYIFKENIMMSFREYQWSYGFWRYMYDREFLISNKINFPLYSRYQDPPFLVKAMLYAEHFYSVSKATYIYRMSSKSIELTYEKTRDCLFAILDVLDTAKKEKLGLLYKETLNHVDRIAVPLYHQILNGHLDLKKLLIKTKKIIDSDLAGLDKDKLPYQFEVERKLILYKETKKKEKEFLSYIKPYKTIIIYGAGYVGKLLGDYLLDKMINKDILYAVTNMNSTETYYKNIAIKKIYDYNDKYKSQALVIIAVMDNLQDEIHDTLTELHFENIYKLNFSEFQLYLKE